MSIDKNTVAYSDKYHIYTGFVDGQFYMNVSNPSNLCLSISDEYTDITFGLPINLLKEIYLAVKRDKKYYGVK